LDEAVEALWTKTLWNVARMSPYALDALSNLSMQVIIGVGERARFIGAALLVFGAG
jgi:hypothetical protein